MSLERSQREFLDVVLAGGEPDDPRLAVYHRTARAARRGALAAAYPVVERLVGPAWFGEAAARHAEGCPSRSGDLGAYGGDFAQFLEGYAHARALPYLADVARLEWAVHESVHAADGTAFDYAALARVPAERLDDVRLWLRPSVRLVASGHPVLAIWEANQPGRDGTPEVPGGPARVLVRRIGWEVCPVAVEAGEWALLESFARGEPLGMAAARCEQAGGELQAALARMATLEALGGFEVDQR